MKYTDKQIYMDNFLVHKLDLMCHKMEKHLDNLLIIDGDEGFGKTTLAGIVGYFIAYKMNRPFSHKNFFFDLNELIDFVGKTKEQVIIWDEAALGGLAVDWSSKMQKKLIQLMMIARKKKHFIIFNIPRFFKLNEYLVIDRAVGLIHVYSPDGVKLGNFGYYRNKNLEDIYYDWKKSRRRNYKKFYNFIGKFGNDLDKIIDIDEYEKRKDEAILKFVEKEDVDSWQRKTILLRYDVFTKFNLTPKEIGKKLGVDPSTIRSWGKYPKKYPELFENGRKK